MNDNVGIAFEAVARFVVWSSSAAATSATESTSLRSRVAFIDTSVRRLTLEVILQGRGCAKRSPNGRCMTVRPMSIDQRRAMYRLIALLVCSACALDADAPHARDAIVVNPQPLGADELCTVARQVAAGGVDLDLSPV